MKQRGFLSGKPLVIHKLIRTANAMYYLSTSWLLWHQYLLN